MNIALLLEMAALGFGDRVALGSRRDGMTFATLEQRATATAGLIAGLGAERVVFVGLNGPVVPLLFFGGARVGAPFVPLNYRLPDDQLNALLEASSPALVVADADVQPRLRIPDGSSCLSTTEVLAVSADAPAEVAADGDAVAILLHTSGTTGAPKAAVLRHRHLTSYIVGSVEFGGAGEDEAALVSVPPYHVAAMASVLSSTYSGRRVVHLTAFEPKEWVATARVEAVSHAMVVPTMLGRIIEVVEADGKGLPALRALSYGGGRMPVAVIEQAMALLPHVAFVNAYGLTETSSTIAMLDPDGHRVAAASSRPEVRARLCSVGRPLPTVEVEVRDERGNALPVGGHGEIWVRGEQVSGEYLGVRGSLDAGGWFCTRDGGWVDDGGFLFVTGRLDDVIVRGGENISPGEIEDVLLEHPAVTEVAVLGVPDDEWGERVVAAVVPAPGATPDEDALRDHVRARLRSSRTPERIYFRDELPYSETGKLLRRVLRAELAE